MNYYQPPPVMLQHRQRSFNQKIRGAKILISRGTRRLSANSFFLGQRRGNLNLIFYIGRTKTFWEQNVGGTEDNDKFKTDRDSVEWNLIQLGEGV